MPDNYFDKYDEVIDPNQDENAPDYVAPNYFDKYDAQKPTAMQSLAASTGEPFNRGVIGMLEFPVTLMNAAVAGGYALVGADSAPQMRRPLSEMAESAGIIAPEGERAEGVIPRFFEFTGAGIMPAAALMNIGRLAITELSAVPTALKQLGMASAKSPGAMTAYDIASNFTAASGGEIARQFTDNETIIAMAELGSAFLPTATILLAKAGPTGRAFEKASNWVLETILPFTKAGGKVAASKRLQDVAGDPKALAEALDLDSPIPPLQQSGDPGMLQLQDMILKGSPAMRQEWSEELALAIEQLSRSARLPGGDFERAVHLLNISQQKAVEEASAAVQRLGSNATPREISIAARRAVERSLDDATKLEKQIWDALDSTAPADIENAATVLSEIIAKRSPDADPKEIPEWLLSKMSRSPIDSKLMSDLQKQGYADMDGVIDPAILAMLEKEGLLNTRQRTLDDVKVLRGRVLQEIRDEKAAQGRGPNRNKLRILNKVQAALLDDMTATGVKGVDDARAFSKAINERFRSGKVGKLLGFDATGAERVAEADFLQNIVYGPASATNSRILGEMASEAPEFTLNFIRAKYLKAVVGENGEVSQTAHRAFIKTMDDKGMFEVFPELQAELQVVAKTGAKAMELNVPDYKIGSTALSRNQSRAALLLQANPGDEMSFVLKSKNPSGAIQDLMKVRTPNGRLLASDRAAVLGLQDSFIEEVFNMSAKELNGIMVPRGDSLKVLFDKYKPVMRALHMSDQQISRLKGISEQIRLAQMRPTADVDIGSSITGSVLKKPIEYLARIIGAKYGAQLGGGTAGGSIQTAGIGSKALRDRIAKLTAGEAERLLILSANDGELYRSLLVGSTASTRAQERAAAIIERHILQLGSIGTTTLAIGASQQEQ